MPDVHLIGIAINLVHNFVIASPKLAASGIFAPANCHGKRVFPAISYVPRQRVHIVPRQRVLAPHPVRERIRFEITSKRPW